MSMAQQFTEGLNVTAFLKAGGSKGVAQHMWTNLFQFCLCQIHFDAFSVASWLYGFLTRSRKEPGIKREIFLQVTQRRQKMFWYRNFPFGCPCLWPLYDDFCMSISARNTADCAPDKKNFPLQVKIAPLQAANFTYAQSHLHSKENADFSWRWSL